MIAITRAAVTPYTVPTEGLESDGTLEWTSTTIVIVEVTAGDVSGLGYTYGHKAVATLVADMLLPIVDRRDAMDVAGTWVAMTRAIRNQGRPGIASMAVAAVDAALWDLKARLLNVPWVTLLGAARDAVPVYGSGGFTSYSLEQLQGRSRQPRHGGMHQISRVKMKVGRSPRYVRKRATPAGRDRFLEPCHPGSGERVGMREHALQQGARHEPSRRPCRSRRARGPSVCRSPYGPAVEAYAVFALSLAVMAPSTGLSA